MKVARSPWVAGVLFALALACHAAETTRLWTFEADPLAQIAPGFSNHVGQWQVVAVDGGQALAQLAKNPDDVFNITLVDDTRAKDIDLKVDLRPIAGQLDQGGGLVWRAADAKNYYLARYNPLEDNYRFYTVVAGKRRLLRDAKIDRTPGIHTLRITMRGDHVQCFFDGRKVLDATDATFADPGQIGLWTKSDAQSQFDNLSLTAD